MDINNYLIDHRSFDWPQLLAKWAWLLPNRLTVWLMNRFGDLFVVMDDGAVWMLDVGGGSFQKLADSREDFRIKVDEGDNASDWYMIPLVDQLRRQELKLELGQCYSYKRPPVLGGAHTVENACVLSVAEHYGFYACIHDQIRDLPDGAQVVIRVKE